VSGLPYGLTKKAIAAAYRIKFKPIVEHGRRTSVWRAIEYNSIYINRTLIVSVLLSETGDVTEDVGGPRNHRTKVCVRRSLGKKP
jgi:hypothetical protein